MKYMILLAGVLLSVLGACTRNEDITPDASEGSRTQMAFNVSVPGELEGNLFREGDEMGVFILPEGGGEENSTDNYNTRLVYESGEWKSEAALYWLSNEAGSRVEMIGYYPYRLEAGKELLSLQVEADQTGEGCRNSEFLWGKTTLTKGELGAPQTAEMRHLTSALVFHVRIDNEFSGKDKCIDNLRVKSYADGWLDCLTGEVSLKENPRWLAPYRMEVPDSWDDETYVCRISPQQYEDMEFLTFQWGDKSFSKDFTCLFEAGKVYQFTLQISDAPLLVLDSQMPIEDWKEEQHTAEMEKYQMGDPWPDADNVQGYVVRLRKGSEPGLVVGIPPEDMYQMIVPERYGEVMDSKQSALQSINWTENTGSNSMLEMRMQFGDLSDFPGFNYCASLGGGWFIPTLDELSWFFYEFFYMDSNLKKERVEWWQTHISSGTLRAFTSTLYFQWEEGREFQLSFLDETTYEVSFPYTSLRTYWSRVLPFRYY